MVTITSSFGAARTTILNLLCLADPADLTIIAPLLVATGWWWPSLGREITKEFSLEGRAEELEAVEEVEEWWWWWCGIARCRRHRNEPTCFVGAHRQANLAGRDDDFLRFRLGEWCWDTLSEELNVRFPLAATALLMLLVVLVSTKLAEVEPMAGYIDVVEVVEELSIRGLSTPFDEFDVVCMRELRFDTCTSSSSTSASASASASAASSIPRPCSWVSRRSVFRESKAKL